MNNLEQPLPPKESSHIIGDNQLVYPDLIIPILPDNVPIHLFDEIDPDMTQVMNTPNTVSNHAVRHTGDVLLPLLLKNEGAFARKNRHMSFGIVSLILMGLRGVNLKKNITVNSIVRVISVRVNVLHVIWLIMKIPPIFGRNIVYCV